MSTIRGIFEPFYKYVKRQLSVRQTVLGNYHNNGFEINDSGVLTGTEQGFNTSGRFASKGAKFRRSTVQQGQKYYYSTKEEARDLERHFNLEKDSLPDVNQPADPNIFFTQTTEKQCTIRMASGVDLDKNLSSKLLEDHEILYREQNFARLFVLESGTKNLAREGLGKNFSGFDNLKSHTYSAEDFKKSSVWEQLTTEERSAIENEGSYTTYVGDGAYGNPELRSDAKDGFGRVPMPGIIDAEIRTKSNDGSLREARVNFRCHNRRQLEILEMLYMRPGFPILLEWGWNPYVSNEFQREKGSFDVFDKFFDEESSIDDINDEVRKNKELADGNYDGFLGYVKNYTYKSREDGGYDCTTEIIAHGEILESLQSSKIVSKLTTRKRADGKQDAKIEVGDKFLFLLKAIKQNLNSAGERAFLKYFGTINHKVIDYENFRLPILSQDKEARERYTGPRAVFGFDLVKAWKNNSGVHDRQWVKDILKGEGYEDWEIDRIFGSGGLVENGVVAEEIIIDPETKETFYVKDINKVNNANKERFQALVNLVKEVTKGKYPKAYEGRARVGRTYLNKGGHGENFEYTGYNIDPDHEDYVTLRGQGLDFLLGGTIVRQVMRFDSQDAGYKQKFEWKSLIQGKLGFDYREDSKAILKDKYKYQGNLSNSDILEDTGYRKNIFLRWDLICQIINLYCTDQYKDGEPVVKLEYMNKNQKSYKGAGPSLNDTYTNADNEEVEYDIDEILLEPHFDENGKIIPVSYIRFANPDYTKTDKILGSKDYTYNSIVGVSYDERICLMPNQPSFQGVIPRTGGIPYRTGETFIDNDFVDPEGIPNNKKTIESFWVDLTSHSPETTDGESLIEAGHNSIGYVMFNLDYLIKEYEAMRIEHVKTEEGDAVYTRLNNNFSMFDYIKKIWDGVNDACGGYYNFQVTTEHERPNYVRVIDKTLSGTEELSVDDLYTFDFQGLGSIVRDLYFDSAITNDMSSMISVAAMSPKSIYSLGAMTFKKFSENIRCRFTDWKQGNKTSEDDKDYAKEILKQDIKKYREIVPALLNYMIKFNNSLNDSTTNVTSNGLDLGKKTIRASVAKQYAQEIEELEYSILERYPLEISKGVPHPKAGLYIPHEENSLRKSAIIPLNVNLKLDGIAGILPLNLFRLNPDKLPFGYQRDDIAFIVNSEVQKITAGQDWTTDIGGQLVLLDIVQSEGSNAVELEGPPKEQKPNNQGKENEFIEFVNPFEGKMEVTSPWPFRNSGKDHTGLDLRVAQGTPLVAVRPGRILSYDEMGGFNLESTIDPDPNIPSLQKKGWGNVVCIEFTTPYDKITLTHNWIPAPDSSHPGNAELGKPLARACYAHMSRVDVDQGGPGTGNGTQYVDQGEQIGLSGGANGTFGSGHSGGPHLHIELGTDQLFGSTYRRAGGVPRSQRKQWRNKWSNMEPELILDDKWKNL